MPVSSVMKPGLTDKSRVKILTVDTANRRVEGVLKDGSMIQIAVWDVPNAFRWPQETEIWIVRRDNGIWMLDRRAQVAKLEALPVTKMAPGQMKLDSTAIYDSAGNTLLHSGSATGGDLSGSLPNPTVAKINGTAVPLTSAAWIAPTLINWWVIAGVNTPVGYFKDPLGIVHLRGRIKSGAAGTVAFILPAGDRPGNDDTYSAAGLTASNVVSGAAIEVVASSGNVIVFYTSGVVDIGLGGITFLAEN